MTIDQILTHLRRNPPDFATAYGEESAGYRIALVTWQQALNSVQVYADQAAKETSGVHPFHRSTD